MVNNKTVFHAPCDVFRGPRSVFKTVSSLKAQTAFAIVFIYCWTERETTIERDAVRKVANMDIGIGPRRSIYRLEIFETASKQVSELKRAAKTLSRPTDFVHKSFRHETAD